MYFAQQANETTATALMSISLCVDVKPMNKQLLIVARSLAYPCGLSRLLAYCVNLFLCMHSENCALTLFCMGFFMDVKRMGG